MSGRAVSAHVIGTAGGSRSNDPFVRPGQASRPRRSGNRADLRCRADGGQTDESSRCRRMTNLGQHPLEIWVWRQAESSIRTHEGQPSGTTSRHNPGAARRPEGASGVARSVLRGTTWRDELKPVHDRRPPAWRRHLSRSLIGQNPHVRICGNPEVSNDPRLHDRATAPAHGNASAMYSLGTSSQPIVTTRYCFPSTI